MLVEKILEPGEELPASWATAGTTGYDALAHIDRVLTDPAGQAAARRARGPAARRRRSTGTTMIHDTKREVADGILHSEVNRITREVAAAAARGDRPRRTVADAVAELLACFPVYRSYLPEGREHLDQAFALARGAPPRPARRRSTCCCRCCPTRTRDRPGGSSRPAAW